MTLFYPIFHPFQPISRYPPGEELPKKEDNSGQKSVPEEDYPGCRAGLSPECPPWTLLSLPDMMSPWVVYQLAVWCSQGGVARVCTRAGVGEQGTPGQYTRAVHPGPSS